MVTFHGERVQGRYVLFRTGGKNWMIHRMDPPQDPEREPMPEQLVPMLARTGPLPPDDGRWALRGQVGRRARDRLRGGRAAEARVAATGATSRLATPSCAGWAGARLARGDPRRRGRRLRRTTASRASSGCSGACTSRPRTRCGGSPARARRLRDLRPAVARRALADGPSPTRSAASGWPSSGSTARAGRRPPTASATATALLEATRAQGLEGIIAKRLDCPYTPGRRSPGWVKVKNVRRTDVVIGGWLPGEGGRSGRLGALVVGYHDEDGALRYAGRVGTGFDERELERAWGGCWRSARGTRQPVRGPPAAEADALRRAGARLRRRVHGVDPGGHAAPAVLQGAARRRGRR